MLYDRIGNEIGSSNYSVSFTNNINAGTATVTVKMKGEKYEGKLEKTFTISKTSQTVTASSSASAINVGKTCKITASGIGTISYTSSDTTIATVSTTGVVTAKKVGTVKITVKAAGNTNYNVSSKTITIKVTPAAPTSLTAVNVSTGIKLTWSKVTGATGYYVYRGSTKIATVSSGTTVTYTDTKATTNGTKYTYKIIPYASTGSGASSKVVTTYRITTPTISSATNSAAGKATVKWAKNSTATGYEIKYVVGSTTKTVKVSGASTVSKVLSSLTKGSTYKIYVRAYKTVSGVTYYSAYSAAKSVKITK